MPIVTRAARDPDASVRSIVVLRLMELADVDPEGVTRAARQLRGESTRHRAQVAIDKAAACQQPSPPCAGE